MALREKPDIIDDSSIGRYHDWRKNDYTRLTPNVNYCNIDTSKIPNKPGIYFFYSGEELLYIGKAKNLKIRISAHISINKHITKYPESHRIDQLLHRINHVEFEVYPEEDLDWIELFFQTKLHPSLNALTWKNSMVND